MPYLRRRRPITHKVTFQDVALNVTFRCNLACVGCDRASFIKPEHSPPMTLQRLHCFLREVMDAGVELKRIRIVGGEPTLHPHFREIVAMCMDYAYITDYRCNVRIFSNRHTDVSRSLLAVVANEHPKLQILGAHKTKSATFPRITRFEYVSPKDCGIDCPWPCPNMGGRGKCGSGVDQGGYFLCPTAGPINSILDLNAGAKTVKQMLDQDFVHWQAETICSHCGQFMAYTKQELPQLWRCNGTPVSETYRAKLTEKGFMA